MKKLAHKILSYLFPFEPLTCLQIRLSVSSKDTRKDDSNALDWRAL